ncbi:phage protease [Salinarimonas chemoclinalis]|uniref:phage protease n=1 Tax=Salinarimonas chemoclinalis TaxID=3241599 RepID=UPI003556C38A
MSPPALFQAAAAAVQLPANVPTTIHLLPAGTFQCADGRGPFTVANASELISASFAIAAGQTLPIDYDHATDLAAPKGGPAPAAGWIASMHSRADGIWGDVEWTPAATERIRNREYRFISPVIMFGADGRVRRIARASLTNNPALVELTSLNARRAEPGAVGMTMDQFLAELRKLLELDDPAADPAAVIEAIKSMKKAGGVDPAKYVPMSVFQQTAAELAAAHQGCSLQAAQMAVDKAIEDGRLFVFMKDWALELCMSNRPAFDSFVDNLATPVAGLAQMLKKADGNQIRDPGARAGRRVDEVHTRLGLSPDDVAKYGKGA